MAGRAPWLPQAPKREVSCAPIAQRTDPISGSFGRESAGNITESSGNFAEDRRLLEADIVRRAQRFELRETHSEVRNQSCEPGFVAPKVVLIRNLKIRVFNPRHSHPALRNRLLSRGNLFKNVGPGDRP